jgi:hypothetical protein
VVGRPVADDEWSGVEETRREKTGRPVGVCQIGILQIGCLDESRSKLSVF